MSDALPVSSSPQFPLLNKVIEQFDLLKEQPFSGIGIIISQHLVPSILPLFHWLFALGVKAEHLAILGKCYSTDSSTRRWLEEQGAYVMVASSEEPGLYKQSLRRNAHNLWDHARKWSEPRGIIACDHGGFLRSTVPTDLNVKLVCVEHTTQGIFEIQNNHYPCIDMARSFPKKQYEGEIIALQIVRALEEGGQHLASLSIGVIGCGTIGRAVCRELCSRGYLVGAVDPFIFQDEIRACGAIPYKSAQKLIADSTLILGCTGRDISALFDNVVGQKILASCSSGDIEFSTLLQKYKKLITAVGKDWVIKKLDCQICVIDRGFPINFAYAKHSFDANIELTRSLTLLSLTQASRLLRDNLYLGLASEFLHFFEDERSVLQNVA